MMNDRHFQITATKSLFDELIDRHADAYLAAYPEIKEFSSFDRSGTLKYYIGMVWTNDYERPNEFQLRIRGSQTITKNKTIEIDIGALSDQQSFFPGQIIAFLADPLQSKQLTVRKILEPIAIAPALKRIDMIDDVNLMVAAGPFMAPDTLDTSIFDRLIESITAHEATHIILIGPLVDLENSAIRSHFDDVWKDLIDRLCEGLHEYECHIYIVPSNRDIMSSELESSYLYPCPKIKLPFSNIKRDIKLKCQIESVSDPSQIDLGGLYLDLTSSEILFHMNRSTLFVNKGDEKPFNSLFRHLITHGIYPLYPCPNDLAVDHAKMSKYLHLDRLAPHIIVLTTRFNAAINEIEDRLIVTVQKCSLRKQAVLVKIPKIDGSEETNSLLGKYTSKTIDLIPKIEDSGDKSVE